MMRLMCLCLLYLLSVTGGGQATEPLVTTKFGPVRGFIDKAIDGREFFAFKGIPFAEKPVGELRFKDPRPFRTPWDGNLNATQPYESCTQLNIFAEMMGIEGPPVVGQEDCLYLSIFSPKIGKGSDLPVMVYIHGGGFIFGRAEDQQPHIIMTEDIVLVVVQYRLGFFGFLSTEDDEAPGNAGLKDQTESLRWVRDNIAEFGGNPNSVTIFGESAGGASVSLQLMTDESKGLFHRAIMQSGSGNCIWSYIDKPKENAFVIAKELKCSEDVETLSSSQLVQCLQTKSVQDIVLSGSHFPKFGFYPMGSGPSADGKYLKAHPDELISRGKFHKVDLMAGMTKDEGMLITQSIYNDENMVKILASDPALSLNIPSSHTNADQVAESIFSHYFGKEIDVLNKPRELNELFGDRFINVCVENTKSAFLKSSQTAVSKTYWYEFSYSGESSIIKGLPMPLLKDKRVLKDWVGHADELIYLFPGVYFTNPPTSDDDKKVSRMLVKLWTNFAKTGNPTPSASEGFVWEQATIERDWYLDITLNPSMKENDRKDAVNFWNSLPLSENFRANPQHYQEIVSKFERRDEL